MAQILTVTVEVCAVLGLIVAETKTITLHMRSPSMTVDVVEVEAAGQSYKQAESFVYLGDTVNSISDVTPEVNRPGGQAWECLVNYSRAVHGNP